jgi:hypothetical protein
VLLRAKIDEALKHSERVMSSEQMTRGIELIGLVAEKVGLRLGSRAVDLFRGMVRLSFEKEIQSSYRSQLRAPAFEFSREFVEDLPICSA